MPGADESGDLPPPVGEQLEQFGAAAVTLKKQLAGSPSAMKHSPGAASVTIAIVASRARSASPMALHTLSGRASQTAQWAIESCGSRACRRASRVVITGPVQVIPAPTGRRAVIAWLG